MLNLEKIKQEKLIEQLINFSILNIDKPAGCTSFDVVDKIRSLLGLEKAGHLGTLDPNVTGVLPIVLGNACKIQEYFMHHDKTYVGVMKLHKQITKEKLEEEMKKFIGRIEQLPPVKSRVKRQLREREVIEFKLLNFDEKKKTAEFIAKVEAGTYIRKLVHDLGLGICGAHMIKLRRTQAGIFSSEDKEFTTLENLEKIKDNEEELRRILIPAEIITKLVPYIKIEDEEIVKKLRNGSPIFLNMNLNLPKEEIFCIFYNNKLIEIARKVNDKEKSNMLAKPEVVFN